MSKEINHQALATKYLEIIKRTAIDIKKDTVKVLELKQGDVVMIDNNLLEVEILSPVSDSIYLTTLDSDQDTYRSGKCSYYSYYDEYIKHLRNLSKLAGMTRKEMKEILESGEYTIS